MSENPALARLIEVMEKVTSGDLSARTNLPHDETDFGRIASDLDKMLDAIAAREAEMLETIEACELIFRFNPIATVIYDPQGHQLRGNRAMCEILGYSEAELADASKPRLQCHQVRPT